MLSQQRIRISGSRIRRRLRTVSIIRSRPCKYLSLITTRDRHITRRPRQITRRLRSHPRSIHRRQITIQSLSSILRRLRSLSPLTRLTRRRLRLPHNLIRIFIPRFHKVEEINRLITLLNNHGILLTPHLPITITPELKKHMPRNKLIRLKLTTNNLVSFPVHRNKRRTTRPPLR